MQIADMMKPNGRVFLKSEWGPINDGWPCLSFTKRSVGDRLRLNFRPGRDVLIYVGTTSPETTEDPEHRSRLISAVTVEANHILETRKIVPPESWASSVANWGDRWPHSMAIIDAANIDGPPYPHAHDVIPAAYRSFAEIANRGGIVEAYDSEREAIMKLSATRLQLNLREDVIAYLKLRQVLSPEVDKLIKQDVWRMADLIIHRVKNGGEPSVKINPLRTAPNFSDLCALLFRKWQEDQKGVCALCGGRLTYQGVNRMLQPSADRIESLNGAYDENNVQITHMGCNLAKNKYGFEQFEDWLSVIRGTEINTL